MRAIQTKRRTTGRENAAFIVVALAAIASMPAIAAEPGPPAGAGAPRTRYAARTGPKFERVFIAGEDQSALWRQTVSKVTAEAPPIRIRSPDPSQSPPVEGLIETSWVNIPNAEASPSVRRKAVVHFIPDGNGAWLETETVIGAASQATILSAGDDTTSSSTFELAQFTLGSEPISGGIPPLSARDDIVTMPPVYPDSWAPFSGPRHPALSRFAHKVVDDYRYFYSCESLVCVAGAVGAAALMANTGFDTTMQNAWQQSVAPTNLGTFFTDCKPMGEGKYAVSVFGAAALTGLLLEGRPSGDIIGEWGSRSLRMFVVGGPPVLILQYATGAPRPSENLPSGSDWLPFHHNGHGASGHAFVGAIPFIAAADMVENPFAKGALYVCSTFTGFSRMTTDSHYPSQVFLGWYIAFASSLAVNKTETKFAGMYLRAVPMAVNNGTGMAIEGRW